MSAQPVLRRRKTSPRLRPFESPHCIVYVLELDPAVLNDPQFAAANSNRISGMPCLYVGMTSLTAEERFGQHISGSKNPSRIARQFGLRLRPDLSPPWKPVRRTWAMEREKRLATLLRSEGFAVWQA